MHKYFILAGFLALAGCPGDKDSGDTSGDTDADADGDSDSDADLIVEVAWGGSDVTLSITNGSGSYWWGIAETDPSSDDPWTGEDCLYGYGGAYYYCHPSSASGVTLSYGATVDNLVEGDTTVFPDNSYAATTAYSLWDASGENCLGAWGSDATYYDGYCEEWTTF